MTENGGSDLVKRAETALSSMALREPDWDGLAERIEGSVKTAPAEDTALFEAPLPVTGEDGNVGTSGAAASDPAPVGDAPRAAASSDPGPAISIGPDSSEEVDDGWSSAPETAAAAQELEQGDALSEPTAAQAPEAPREGVSLADLARSTIARRGSAEATNIAKETLAVASQSRAQSDQIAQRVQAASVPPARPASAAPPPPSARVSAAPPAQQTQGGDVLRGPWVGVTIAAVGLAAGFFLFISGRNNPSAGTETAQRMPVAEAPAPLAPQAPRANVEAPAAKVEPPEAPQAGIDPTSLPIAPSEPAPRAEPKPEPGGAKAAPPAPAPAAPAPGAGKVVAEKIVLEEEGKPAPKAATAAPRPADSKLRPAELSSDTMTDRPSAGAAQAAVGAVLGAARACVAGHPQPSSAQLVFSSDGQVQGVSVAGPAAGTPAAACIEGALKKARVQPFAASSFSLGVTVRPP